MSGMRTAGIVFVFVLGMNAIAAAQGVATRDGDSPDTSSETEGTVTSVEVYDTDYFAPYNPVTVEDMFGRIPGTEGLVGFRRNEEVRRGLRTNTNQILINGKRLTGKESEGGDFLTNLPASSVERIEVITGNIQENEADVGTRVINVVLKEETGGGGGFWDLSGFVNSYGQVRPVNALSYSGASNEWSYSISLQLLPFIGSSDVTDLITTESGQTFRVVEESRRRDQEDYQARTTLAYEWSDGRKVQLNGFLNYIPRDNRDTTLTFLPQSMGSADSQ